MRMIRRMPALTLALAVYGTISTADLLAEESVKVERVDPSSYGRSYIESMDEAIARDRLTSPQTEAETQERHGVWVIPSRRAMSSPHSGSRHVINKRGDTRMGIGFPNLANVHGAYFAGQASNGVWADGISVIGYRSGDVVGQTDWFMDIGADPRWFEIDLFGVDRIEIVALPVFDGSGFYALDDLTFSWASAAAEPTEKRIVVDFDDLPYRTELTGSGYAGLSWEVGTGEFVQRYVVHAPMDPPDSASTEPPPPGRQPGASATRGTLPTLKSSFQGVIRGDAGSYSAPPDTDGAVGPSHYVETVNRNFAVYSKTTGSEITNIHLGSFLPGSRGDPRVLFDQHSWRWIVIVPDFDTTATIFMAVSLTANPMGEWFKTSFSTDSGSDAGCWPDYPTLGVDANGIYTAAYMVGCGMTIFAIDKAPLVAASPSLGQITSVRGLPWEGAIQPAHTYGTPAGQYFLSLGSGYTFKLRRVDPPLTSPSVTYLGTIAVPAFSFPPDAPALGSTPALDTVGDRLMMSVYRDGSLWTAHTIGVDGRAACRWYEIDVDTMSVVQYGTVADDLLHYYFPSIMVNDLGAVAMGFSGSYSGQYAACYYTGRESSDPPGEMAEPVMYKEGLGPQNIIDDYGRNRFGDYSYTTLDPLDEVTIWTIQEYGHSTNTWGTYIAVLLAGFLDCNDNAIFDTCDIDCGPSSGECDIEKCGQSSDCNLNNVPDECETDCNETGVPDGCDIAAGTSRDNNLNDVPDECEVIIPVVPETPHNGRKNRYISINPNNTLNVALRVEMTDSAYFPDSVGVLGWAGEPDANGVSRVVNSPYYTDSWPSVLHLGDCRIVPVATYAVRATENGVLLSDALTVGTIERPGTWFYGDTVGIGLGQPAPFGFTGPNGIVNVNDVQAYLLTAQGDPAPGTHTTWVDLHGLGDGAPPNYILNVSDLQRILFGLEGREYADSADQLDPADCP